MLNKFGHTEEIRPYSICNSWKKTIEDSFSRSFMRMHLIFISSGYSSRKNGQDVDLVTFHKLALLVTKVLLYKKVVCFTFLLFFVKRRITPKKYFNIIKHGQVYHVCIILTMYASKKRFIYQTRTTTRKRVLMFSWKKFYTRLNAL